MGFLEIRKLSRYFGGLGAVLDLDLEVSQGQLIGLIGPNGAGKSTVLNMIGGTLRPSSGHIIFNGIDVTRQPSHRKAQEGISRVFQDNVLFTSYSVFDNVKVGCHLHSKISLPGIFYQTRSSRIEEKKIDEMVHNILEFFDLTSYANEMANSLPHGRQRLLAMAVALASQPKLLLLDEPVTGMNENEIDIILDKIIRLKAEKDITCIIIEHNLKMVMGICERIAVLNFGKKIAEGTPEEIIDHPDVMEAYLGKE